MNLVRKSKLIFTVLICLLLLLCPLAGCVETLSSSKISESVKNLSFHIMVSTEDPIPETANFVWGPQYFKLNYDKSIDLERASARIQSAIRREMEKKKYRLVESVEESEVTIGFAAALGASIDENALNKAYGEKFEFSFPLVKKDASRSYQQGALIIDVLDNRAKKLLWRGAVIADIDMEVSEQEKDKRAASIIGALLRSFPKPKI